MKVTEFKHHEVPQLQTTCKFISVDAAEVNAQTKPDEHHCTQYRAIRQFIVDEYYINIFSTHNKNEQFHLVTA